MLTHDERTPAGWGPPEPHLSVDDILEVLSNHQRRAIIQHLCDAPGQVHSIDDVVNHLKDLEQQRYDTSPGEDHLLSVLVHIHGPKLHEAGLIDYDIPSREIRYHPNEQVEQILEQIETTVAEFAED